MAARALYQTAAFFGRRYSAEELIECGNADCLITSRCGYSFWAHYPLVVDWLGSVPITINYQNQIFLPISYSALRLLIDIIYHRKIHSWNAILELIDYSVAANWWQLVDDLLIHGYEAIEEAGLPRCWVLAHARKLECELALRKKVADAAPLIIKEHRAGRGDLLSTPIEAFLLLIQDDRAYWENGRILQNVVLAWSRANMELAKKHCRELFSAIRFKSIYERRECIVEFRAFFQGLGMSEAALNHATNVYSSMKPRLPRSLLLYMGGWSSREATKNSYFYDVYTNHWSAIPKMNLEMKLSYFRVAMIDRMLYVIGGYSDQKFRTEVWKYDFKMFHWNPCAPMHETKGYFASTSDKYHIYIIGGSDGRNRCATVDRLNVSTNQWESVAPLSIGRSDAAALAFRNRIWVFGGFEGERTLNRVETFDPSTNTWSDMPPMLEPRSGHCVVLFHDKIYVIGGFQHGRSTDTVEFYNPVMGEWSVAPRMTIPRTNFCAVTYEDAIYVMGGHYGEATISQCEKFDGEAWTPVHCLPKNIAAGAAILIDRPTNVEDLLERIVR